jgi:hypothetical protein
MGKALFSAIERAPATQRIAHKAQHDRARVHVHLWGPIGIDAADEAQLGGVGFENGPRVDGGYLALGWDARQSALPRRTWLFAAA